jgi:hypothetical protein
MCMMVLPALVAAQTPAAPPVGSPSPGRTVDLHWGFTSFSVEDERFDHTLIGGGFRAPVTARLAIGPEVYRLRGPGEDRDWVFSGKVTFDLRQDRSDAPLPVVPYIVGGGGVMRHSTSSTTSRDASTPASATPASACGWRSAGISTLPRSSASGSKPTGTAASSSGSAIDASADGVRNTNHSTA